MRAVDLCCGLGGMTAGMLSAGFEVIGVDTEPTIGGRYPAKLLVGDVRTLDPAILGQADWVHASPPCQRFSTARASRAYDPATEADLDILQACLRVRDALRPRFWSVENVRGSVNLFSSVLGPPTFANGPYVFWGNFPPFLLKKANQRKGRQQRTNGPKASLLWKTSSRDARERAMVPATIVEPMAEAVASALAVREVHAEMGCCNLEGA